MSDSTQNSSPNSKKPDTHSHRSFVLIDPSRNNLEQDADGLQRVCYVGNITNAENTLSRLNEIYDANRHPVDCKFDVVAAISDVGGNRRYWRRTRGDKDNDIWAILPELTKVLPYGQGSSQMSVRELMANSQHAKNADGHRLEGNSSIPPANGENAEATSSMSDPGSNLGNPPSKKSTLAGTAGTAGAKAFGGDTLVECTRKPNFMCTTDDEDEDDMGSNCAYSDVPSEYAGDAGAFTPFEGESDVEESSSLAPAPAACSVPRRILDTYKPTCDLYTIHAITKRLKEVLVSFAHVR